MNIKKLVQLAQNDDILLAKYSRRWATGNPVCTALFVYKARLFGWPLVVFCAVLSMIGSAQRIDILASIPAGMIISTLMIALTERRRYKDMIAFCETITSPLTSLSDLSASATAVWAILLASVTCRLISLTEEDSCSDAEAALAER